MKNLYINFFNKPKLFTIVSGPLSGKKIYMAPRHGYKKILGIYEKAITNTIINNIKTTDICIDLGSHVGYFSLLMAKITGKKGKVIAIDPVAECCNFLEKSAKNNNFKNILVLNTAVGEKNTKKKAYVFEDSGMANFEDSGFKIYEGKENYTFEVRRLDDILKDQNITNCSFIKIDIEGYEYNALLGAIKILKKKPKLLIEIHDMGNYKKIYNLLKDYNYSIFDLQENKMTKNQKLENKIFHILAK